jgi:hypothetical protein
VCFKVVYAGVALVGFFNLEKKYTVWQTGLHGYNFAFGELLYRARKETFPFDEQATSFCLPADFG